MADNVREREADLPHARQRRTRWPGWVWLIPATALGFAGWLAAEEWLWGPRSVTVQFADVEGIKPGAPVRYRGLQVGRVAEMQLGDGFDGVELALDMDDVMEGHLGEGTQFWIVRPGLAPGEITNLISGAYIGVDPNGEGDVKEFDGLAEPPILVPDEPGRAFVLTADAGEGIASGAPVRFRGVEVGRVLGVRLAEDGVEIPVFLDAEHAGLVRDATVFWRAGGLSLDKGGRGLDIGMPSLGSLATGAVAFDTPEILPGPPAEPGARFALYESRDGAAAVAEGPRLAYAVSFDRPVGGLARGAPVTLGGKTVGRVAAVRLNLGPDDTSVSTPVGIVLDAREIGLDVSDIETREALRERLDALLAELVRAGLRAQVAEGGIVFGGQSIELVMQDDAEPAQLSRVGEFPVIPTVGG